jgi:flagellar assembly factor FliW
VEPGYTLELAEEDARLLEVGTMPAIGRDVLCLALISVHTEEPTANLFAPIVVSLQTRIAAQCFQTGAGYSHQHSLLGAEEGVAA